MIELVRDRVGWVLLLCLMVVLLSSTHAFEYERRTETTYECNAFHKR